MNNSVSKFGKYHPYDLLLTVAVTLALLASPTSCNQHDDRIGKLASKEEPASTAAPTPSTAVSATPTNSKGKALFKANCSSCHLASEKPSAGPGLKDVYKRIPDGDWKYKWVKNSSALAASGDRYAVEIKAKWNNAAMSAFPALSNDDIDAILEYANAGQ